MPNCVVFYENSLMPRPCIISRPIRLATSPGLKPKVCSLKTFSDSIESSPPLLISDRIRWIYLLILARSLHLRKSSYP